FAENTDDLFVGKTLLHGDVLMWLMKTLLTSGCTNQRGAGHTYHEEDNTGSTTVWFDSNTGKGVISIMNSHEVIASGTVSNCK
ncbi:hypothetical protein ACQQXA_005082, partial [Escherichia coli]